jgi:hypothetical protein
MSSRAESSYRSGREMVALANVSMWTRFNRRGLAPEKNPARLHRGWVSYWLEWKARGGMSPTNLDPVMAWVKQEHAMAWQQLELMEAGKIGTIEWNGSESVDTTAQTIEHLRVKLATLEALLTEAQSKDGTS